MIELVAGVITVGVIVTIAFLILRVVKGGITAMFVKALASACFIGTAFVAIAFHVEISCGYNQKTFEYAILMLLGFVYSLLGDVWLDLKYVHLDYSKQYTYAGFISFMIGHIFFIPAIVRGFPKHELWMIPVVLVLCAVFAICAALMEKINKNLDYGEFRIITIVYSIFVSGTMFCAILGLLLTGGSKRYLWLTIGSVAFTLSDLVLSSIYFEKDKNTKFNVTLNHILYYFAQFAFASTLLMD